MKHNIFDGFQVALAIIITTSLVVVNAAPIPQKQIEKSAQPTAITKPAETPAPATPQTAQEAVPAPETVVDTTPAPTPAAAAPVVSQPVYSGSHEDWIAAAGIDPANYWAVDFIVSHESSWDPCAYYPSHSNCNLTAAEVNSTGGAYGVACGLGMSLECGKWGANWTDPVNQLVHMNIYVAKYGGWAGAVAHWKAYGNY